ncbi:unnamed protein product [Paramecium sonneborni]|uniref:J domain-containing protein n=1 Tax=Paramecium sonneborni TaxID=65129 RepID=A0A8S1RFP2_9CILI|nr:unnamed protein product [Paramecium sonneborni]
MFQSSRFFCALNRYSRLTKYTKDYYKILNIPKTANQADIRIAYLKMASRYHPDSQMKDEIKYQEVREAFQVLSDTSLKMEFDNYQSKAQEDLNITQTNQDTINNQQQTIQMEFLFKKGDQEFPFNLDIPSNKILSKEELENVSSSRMKKFMLTEGGFEKFFKDNISYLDKGLTFIIEILKLITRKK